MKKKSFQSKPDNEELKTRHLYTLRSHSFILLVPSRVTGQPRHSLSSFIAAFTLNHLVMYWDQVNIPGFSLNKHVRLFV